MYRKAPSFAQALFFTAAIGLFSACSGGDKGDKSGDVGDTGSTPITHNLVLALDGETTTAGSAMGWVATLHGSDGSESSVAASLSSDLEPELAWDGASLSPTVAGMHTVMATLELGEETLMSLATVDVLAAAADSLDLSIDPGSIVAGTTATWSVEAWDAHGNPADVADVVLDTELTVDAGLLTTVVAGSWSVTAQLGGASEEEILVVVADVPDVLVLSLDPAVAEVGDSLVATVTQADQFGNVTDAGWTLSVTSSDGGVATVSTDTVSFDTGGHFLVRAEVPKTAAADEIEIMVDSSGPVIDIEEPDRGDFVFDMETVAHGTVTDDVSGVASFSINGSPVTVASDGSFSTNLALDFGVNVLESEATDGDGNSSSDIRALLAGNVKNYGDAAHEGLIVHIKEGGGGLDVLEDMAADLVSATDLDDMIPSPVYSGGTGHSSFFGGYLASATVYATNPAFGSVDVEIDPRSGGYLDVTFTIHDITLDWNASGDLSYVGYTASGDISVDSLAVTMDVYMSLASGSVGASVANVVATTVGMDFDLSGSFGSVVSLLGIESLIEGELEDALEDALVDAVEDSVPELIEDAFASLEISEDLDVLDTTVLLDAVPSGIAIDDTGVSISLGTTVTVETWTSPYMGLGGIYAGYSTPDLTATGIGVGISLDFLNQLTYAAWGGGVLDMAMTGDELGLDASMTAALFPGVTTVYVDTEALLPPVFVPGTTAGWDYDFQIGGLYMWLWDDDSATTLVELFVSATAPADMEVGSSGDIEISMDTPVVWVDVVSAEGSLLSESALELLVETMLPSALSSLTGVLTEITIPSFDGFDIVGATMSNGGAEGGFAVLGGNLAEAP